LRTLRKPTPKSCKNLLEKSMLEDQIIVIVGSCVVNYRGRAGSVLPEGERLVIMKPDGTLLVHQDEKREPVNWNPPGCKAKVEVSEEGLTVISSRSNPEETLMIVFKELKFASSFTLMDDEELMLVGTESDLVESVIRDPNVIEEGFKIKNREKSVDSGMIDIYGEDSEGRKVALEFKRDKATLQAIGQLSRYAKELRERKNEEVRGIIVAPKITSGALELLDKEDLEYVKIEEPPKNEFEEVVYDKNQRRSRTSLRKKTNARISSFQSPLKSFRT